ncbi:MAG: hypothetical protein AAF637_11025 [Pseudomonadota bacterium]
MLEEERGGPERKAALEPGESMVLGWLRVRLEGVESFERLQDRIRPGRPPTAADIAVGAFEPWFLVLATHCRRDLYLHRQACPCVSKDERRLLDLLAHLQAGKPSEAHRCAVSLVYDRAVIALLGASVTLAEALSRMQLPRASPTTMAPMASQLH